MQKNSLKNIRKAIPAEIIGAYLAIQNLLNSLDPARAKLLPYENTRYALWTIGVLVVVNLLINIKVFRYTSPTFLIYSTMGLVIWIVNVDTRRFDDLLGGYSFFAASIALVFYGLISVLISPPTYQIKKEVQNAE